MTAIKNDQEKPRTDLLPPRALLLVGECLAFGARKYGDQLPHDIPDAEKRLLAAVLRHLLAHMDGQYLDTESEIPHLAHAATNLLFLTEHVYEETAELTSNMWGKGLKKDQIEQTKQAIADLAASDYGQDVKVMNDVAKERKRQKDLWGEQNHASGIHATGFTGQIEYKAKEAFKLAQAKDALTWKLILDEEVAELFNTHTAEDAYTEAIQVAAVALSMAESIKRNGLFGRSKE